MAQEDYMPGCVGGDTLFLIPVQGINCWSGILQANPASLWSLWIRQVWSASVPMIIMVSPFRAAGISDQRTWRQQSFYGIQITKVLTGCGMGIASMSSDVEVDHADSALPDRRYLCKKTDPDCNNLVSRNPVYNIIPAFDNHIPIRVTGLYIRSSIIPGCH